MSEHARCIPYDPSCEVCGTMCTCAHVRAAHRRVASTGKMPCLGFTPERGTMHAIPCQCKDFAAPDTEGETPDRLQRERDEFRALYLMHYEGMGRLTDDIQRHEATIARLTAERDAAWAELTAIKLLCPIDPSITLSGPGTLPRVEYTLGSLTAERDRLREAINGVLFCSACHSCQEHFDQLRDSTGD